jgi:carbon starvation protein
MISVVVVVTIAVLGTGYFTYGRFLTRQIHPNNALKTPANEVNDGIDYVPAKASLLLGQHFSAIAAAGPIVGPIMAGLLFGWLPAILWIILGSIFIGGVHDYFSLLGSVRHKASSIGEIVRQHISPGTRWFFMLFVWMALMYVVIAFTDITAQTFLSVQNDTAYGPAVAASSILYLSLALVMGIFLRFFKIKLWLLTAIFIPLVLLSVWIGPHLPKQVLDFFGGISAKQWGVFLLVYCFIASIIPMWLLLQPRGYLGGWLLYVTIFIGLAGALFGGYKIQYPAVNLSGLHSLETGGKLLFPFLFITIACGACSGFHALVSSGTTSKQLNKESDAYCIGYGGMLLEGLVAVLALATVMMLPHGSPELANTDPNIIYAKGLSKYLGLLGIGFNVAFPFALLAFSTFVYDTLDVSTRLARYVFQEMLGWRSFAGGCAATLISLALPLVFLLSTKEKSYLVAWPIFGTSNQMLASLTLLALAAWMAKSGKRVFYIVIPMIFMMVMTIVALVLQIQPFIASWLNKLKGVQAKPLSPDAIISGICGIILLILSCLMIITSARAIFRKKAQPAIAKEP